MCSSCWGDGRKEAFVGWRCRAGAGRGENLGRAECSTLYGCVIVPASLSRACRRLHSVEAVGVSAATSARQWGSLKQLCRLRVLLLSLLVVLLLLGGGLEVLA